MDRKKRLLKRILLIDEQPVCKDGLEHILEDSADFHLQSFCSSLDDLTNDLPNKPDLIAIDISVARSKGIAAIRELKTRFPLGYILVLTGHDEVLFAERCLKAGAKGYLMKTANKDELINALKNVAEGNLHVSERMRARMLTRLSGLSGSQDEVDFDRLSDRELLIVQHIGQSKNNKEIANELQISIKTIESHRSRIKSKLQLSSPNELVRYAMKLQKATI
ncbi:MAG: response regulator transcription factor [Verrucomicrobiota bacterium]